MNQQALNKYFATEWSGFLGRYEHSGYELTAKVQSHEHVLDVGCGLNEFSGLIPNLVGIDPAFEEADVRCTIEDYRPDQLFDVAFCLGSINFGKRKKILEQIQLVVDLLKPQARIYWRCNPGQADHGNETCKSIDFFPWTAELLQEFAEQFGFAVADLQQDSNNRIYCEWVR